MSHKIIKLLNANEAFPDQPFRKKKKQQLASSRRPALFLLGAQHATHCINLSYYVLSWGLRLQGKSFPLALSISPAFSIMPGT